MRWGSVVGGVLALALLEVAVSSGAAAGRAGALLESVATVISHVLSPTVAAIPDLRKHGGAASPSSSTGSTSTGGGIHATSGPTAGSLLPAEWTTSAAAAAT